MKMVAEYKENIAQHFPILIEYGNDGMFTNEEEEQLKEWIDAWEELHPNTNIIFSYGEESFFSHRCDICKLGATCVECTITVFEK